MKSISSMEIYTTDEEKEILMKASKILEELNDVSDCAHSIHMDATTEELISLIYHNVYDLYQKH